MKSSTRLQLCVFVPFGSAKNAILLIFSYFVFELFTISRYQFCGGTFIPELGS